MSKTQPIKRHVVTRSRRWEIAVTNPTTSPRQFFRLFKP
jgi:hypothetical protein